VQFCPKCGNILVPEKKKKGVILVCKKCNRRYRLKEKKLLAEKFEDQKKEIVVMEKDEGLKEFPKTKIICPNCGNDEAYWWMQQTRAADEPPTIFYRCTKCGYNWRSYG